MSASLVPEIYPCVVGLIGGDIEQSACSDNMRSCTTIAAVNYIHIQPRENLIIMLLLLQEAFQSIN